jgi:acyl transferase domain-containing protein
LPPAAAAASEEGAPQLIILSARDDTALAQARSRLAAHVKTHAGENLADMAFTLQTGRGAFGQRFAAVATDTRGLLDKLGAQTKAVTAAVPPPKLAFLFPG